MPRPSPRHAGSPILTGLGRALRHRRKALGISQEQFALNANMDRAYVGGIERGDHNLTLAGLLRLSETLGLKPSELLLLAGY